MQTLLQDWLATLSSVLTKHPRGIPNVTTLHLRMKWQKRCVRMCWRLVLRRWVNLSCYWVVPHCYVCSVTTQVRDVLCANVSGAITGLASCVFSLLLQLVTHPPFSPTHPLTHTHTHTLPSLQHEPIHTYNLPPHLLSSHVLLLPHPPLGLTLMLVCSHVQCHRWVCRGTRCRKEATCKVRCTSYS